MSQRANHMKTEIRPFDDGPLGRFIAREKYLLGAITLIVLNIVFFATICVRKYMCYQYHDWDFALYANGMWNLIHGKAWLSVLKTTLLLDHSSFIAYVVAVPYFVFRHPATLLILQSIALGVSAFPVYLVAKDRLGALAGLIITLLYLSYPALYYAYLYEFYFEAFAVPFLAFAVYFLLRNNKLAFALMIVAACSCKENIPLTIIMLGFFGLTRPHRRSLGLFSILLGALWFYMDVKLLAGPTLQKGAAFGSGIEKLHLYAQYGSNLQEVAMYFIRSPLELVRIVFFDPMRAQLITNTLGILLYIPVLRPDILLINAPHALARLLASNPNEYTVYYHSAAPLAPFVFFSLIFSIRSVIKLVPQTAQYKHYFLVALVIWESFFGISLWKERPSIVRFSFKQSRVREDLVKQIPSEVPVASSLAFLSHLANRPTLRSIHTYFGNRPWWKPEEIPQDLEYVLMDTQDGVIRHMFFQTETLFDKDLLSYLDNNDFGLLKARGELVLFKRGHTAPDRLLTVSKEIGQAPFIYAAKVDEMLTLVRYEDDLVNDYDGVLHFTFRWYKDADDGPDYALNFYIQEGDYDFLRGSHLMGYTMLPTSLWKKGQQVTENYWLVLPKLGQGKHVVSIQAVNVTDKKTAQLTSPNKKDIDQNGKFVLLTLER